MLQELRSVAGIHSASWRLLDSAFERAGAGSSEDFGARIAFRVQEAGRFPFRRWQINPASLHPGAPAGRSKHVRGKASCETPARVIGADLPQLFPPAANPAARLALLGLAVAVSFAATGAALGLRSSFVTDVGRPIGQPIPFSHAHHVGDVGLDCRYCHTGVETSAFAGIPATEVCMTCHSQLFADAPVLAPVRESFLTGVPIHWNRVNDLGDFAYFNHAIHVNKGVGCVTCHGPVDRMPLTWRAHPMQMSWCLSCHRDPAPNLRPKDAVFDPEWDPKAESGPLHRALMRDYGIDPARMTDCYVCHR